MTGLRRGSGASRAPELRSSAGGGSPPRRRVAARAGRAPLGSAVLAPAALGAFLAMLVGCTPAVAPRAEPGPLPDGVTASFVQLRSDVAARQAQVRVHNGTGDDLEISAIEVHDDRFAAPAERALADRVTTLAPGATVDVRIDLPAMACDADAEAGGPRVVMTLDGAAIDAQIEDVLAVLGPLHERECRAERLADAAAVALGTFRPSAHPAPATLDLTIGPTGRGDAVITAIRPTNLLEFDGRGAGALPIGLEADGSSSGRVVVQLPLVPLRCDPHAVQEDKRGTVFTLDVELDGTPGQVELAADEDTRARILAWVSSWCAAAP